MTGDMLYARSVGASYDSDTLKHQLDEGIGGMVRDDMPVFALDGSDLYIASPEEMISQVEHYLAWLSEKAARDNLDMADIDTTILEEAQYAQAEFRRRLDELSENDVLFAHAVQDWALEELRRREEIRGEAYDPSSEDTYHETAAVLDLLIEELQRDEEDPKLIEIAAVWRQETLAELDVARFRRYYSLAA